MAFRLARIAWRTRSVCASRFPFSSLYYSSSFSSSHPLHVCVVGSGPAGFYTAEKMLKSHKRVEVDIIDRLPTPFGLVRSGVAPDHPETKVVLAYGAESDRVLGVPGEDLAGIYSAREFVWWYNGHPDCSTLSPDLRTTDTAVVLGQGNVALDVARILLRDPAELATTDIAEHALVALKESTIRKVYLVGRRGPAQAACTAKELREILGIKNLHVRIQEADLKLSHLDEEELKNSRIQKRVYELLRKGASQHLNTTSCQRELHFVFFRKPDRFLQSDSEGRVSGVCLEKTALKESDTGKQFAFGTGQFEDLQAGLVLKSIGYKSLSIDGLPFDGYRGIVPNIRGRVLKDDSEPHVLEKGLYVTGWLKRGPTGIIATNLYCSEETVHSISEDVEHGKFTEAADMKLGRASLVQLLENKGITYVTFSDWERIDSIERAAGRGRNKPREKIASWDELSRAAKA